MAKLARRMGRRARYYAAAAWDELTLFDVLLWLNAVTWTALWAFCWVLR